MSREAALASAFPDVDAGIRPTGSFILVQVRASKRVTDKGVHLPDEARDTEKWNTQVGRVLLLGPLAYRNRNNFEPWPEGAWANPGDYVRVPKYGGDRWEVPYGPGDDKACFVLMKDTDVMGVVTGDPLAIKAFI